MAQPENNTATQEWELPEDFLLSNLNYNSDFNTYEFPDNYLKFFDFQNQVPQETPEEAKEREKAVQDQIKLGLIRVVNQNTASIPYHPSLDLHSTPPTITVMNGKQINTQPILKDNKALNGIINKILNPKKPVDIFTANAGKNDPCPCGSGKKFKKCHGR